MDPAVQSVSEARWKIVTLVGVLVLPLVGMGLLLAVPDVDVRWEHHPSHFCLVLTNARGRPDGPAFFAFGAVLPTWPA